ncbi:hypothetical protein J437_LFUL012808 [Ladona fulva]|uniref:Uncharacterized protein n=1 Tax=Ladona fulva TaxID=123851 RepID=A0A8K0P7D8_LADFU|nr:hypothetical protein J437_LFUL012808 [Ladona fulva]
MNLVCFLRRYKIREGDDGDANPFPGDEVRKVLCFEERRGSKLKEEKKLHSRYYFKEAKKREKRLKYVEGSGIGKIEAGFSRDDVALRRGRAKKNKNVLLLSTMHQDVIISRTQKRKSDTILFYNANKVGVNLMDTSINSWMLFRETTGCKLSHASVGDREGDLYEERKHWKKKGKALKIENVHLKATDENASSNSKSYKN